MTSWRNRIVGHGEEDAEQLLANPRNWRIHPKAQQDALSGVLDEIGWIQDVIVNRQTGFVLDGHLRVALAISRGEKVPVVYVDLSPEEEALALVTLDPVAAMAVADKEQLAGLLREIQSGSSAIEAMLADLAKASGLDYGEQPTPRFQEAGPYHVKQAGIGVWACLASDREQYERVRAWKRTDGEEGGLVGEMAEALSALIRRWQSSVLSDWQITNPPQGASLGKRWMGRELAEGVAVRLGLSHVFALARADVKRYHHPMQSLQQRGYQVLEGSTGVMLVIDDVISSGRTMTLALEALRGYGIAAFGFAWLYNHTNV